MNKMPLRTTPKTLKAMWAHHDQLLSEEAVKMDFRIHCIVLKNQDVQEHGGERAKTVV
jgi:hypothetical protein